jgi:hypothetical protein
MLVAAFWVISKKKRDFVTIFGSVSHRTVTTLQFLYFLWAMQ